MLGNFKKNISKSVLKINKYINNFLSGRHKNELWIILRVKSIYKSIKVTFRVASVVVLRIKYDGKTIRSPTYP